jgi:hypothetical protein
MLIGDPSELDRPTHIPRLTWTGLGNPDVTLCYAARWFAIGDPLRK